MIFKKVKDKISLVFDSATFLKKEGENLYKMSSIQEEKVKEIVENMTILSYTGYDG